MKLNAVRFKDKSSFNKNKSKLNVKEVHEPFNIIVFADEQVIAPDFTKVASVDELESSVSEIPTGLAIVIANDFEKAKTFFQNNKIEIKNSFTLSNTFIVEINVDNYGVFRKNLLKSGLFLSIEQDHIFKAEKNADYFSYDAQWHLGNVSAKEGWALMPSGVVGDVAVLDLGCETTHEDLVGATNANWNCVYNNSNVEPVVDDEKHGTACTGVIAARTDNNKGVSSIGGNFLRVQFLQIGYNVTGGSFSTTDSICTLAINKAIENPFCVAVSMSFGGGGARPNFENALNIARTQGRQGRGIPCFASSGNNGFAEFTQLPAAYSSVMAIGASTTLNQKANFSNAGSKLFAAACGVSIKTTDRTGLKGYMASGDPILDNYTNFSGTSAACPLFAGIAGLVLLKNPTLTEVQLRDIFRRSCRKIGGYTYVNDRCNELGYGIVELKNALTLAGGGSVDPIPIATNLTSFVSIPTTANAGSSIPIQFSAFTNNANMPIANIECKVWLSLSTNINASSVLISTLNISLGGGKGIETQTINYTLPSGISGNYFIVGSIDTTNVVVETSDTDNSSSASILITSPTQQGLDMAVKVESYKWLADGRLSISYSLKNIGQQVITSYSFTCEFVGGYKVTSNKISLLAVNNSTLSTINYPLSVLPTSYPATFKITILKVNGILDSLNQNESSILINR